MLDLGVVICINISYVYSVNSFKEESEKKSDQRTGKYFSPVISLLQLLICVCIYDKCKFLYENTNNLIYI